MAKKLRLSVSMIVRDEHDMLPICLESIKGVDEIIVCDTGSNDDTVEIAKKYTDRVYTDFVWCDDFSKARNHSKSKCTGDWILIVDADEVLASDLKEVMKVVRKADREGYMFINTKVVAKGTKTNHWYPRIFKNIPEISWYGAAHNYLAYSGKSVSKSFKSDLEVHYGYSPAHKADPERTLRILKKAVEENPALVRERFYLAREYYYRRDWDKTLEHLDEYIKRSRFLGERNDAWLMKAYCMAELKRYNEACDCAWQALKYNANFKEALIFLANHMDSINKQAWRKYADLADNTNVLFVREVK